MKKIFTYTFLVLFLIVNTSFKNAPKHKMPALLGIAIKYVVSSGIWAQVKDATVLYVKNFLTKMGQKQLALNTSSRNDVEQITIKITDNNNDGELEYSTFVEDHNGDGYADNLQTLETEENNAQQTLETLLNNEFSFIDDYYLGDIDLDGED